MNGGHWLLELLQAGDRRKGSRACRVCGCTDRYGCWDGCGWAGADLCTRCATIRNDPVVTL